MGIGASLILIAAGAILWLAVDVDAKGVDLNLVGAIVLIVGAVGLALSLVLWSSLGSWGPWRREVIREEPVPPYRDRYPDRD